MRYLALALFLLCAGCGETAEDGIKSLSQKFASTQKWSPETKAKAIRTLVDLLHNECKDLWRYEADIKKIQLSYYEGEDVWGWPKDRFGWKEYLELVVSVKDGATSSRLSDLGGRNLYFYAGVGTQTGIHAGKEQGNMVCGFSKKYKDFLIVPRLWDVMKADHS